MSAIPLPAGNNAAEMIRRLRAIDAEIFGTLFANAGIIGGDVTIQGSLVANDIYSGNWNGLTPLAIGDTGDPTATTGYGLDGGSGNAQFENVIAQKFIGDIEVDGLFGWAETAGGGWTRSALAFWAIDHTWDEFLSANDTWEYRLTWHHDDEGAFSEDAYLAFGAWAYLEAQQGVTGSQRYISLNNAVLKTPITLQGFLSEDGGITLHVNDTLQIDSHVQISYDPNDAFAGVTLVLVGGETGTKWSSSIRFESSETINNWFAGVRGTDDTGDEGNFMFLWTEAGAEKEFLEFDVINEAVIPRMPFRAPNDSASAPSYSWGSGTGNGMFRDGNSSIGWSTSGVERMQCGTSNLNFNKAVTGSASILNSSIGSESTPCFTFAGDPDTGMIRVGTNQLVLSTAGTRAIHMSAAQHVSFGDNTTGRASIRNVSGDVDNPTYSFTGDLDIGIYRSTSNQISMGIAGNNEFLLGATGFLVPNVYNTTTTGTANVYVSSDGRMRRETSTEAHKEEITAWKGSGILDVQPVTFYGMSGNLARGEPMERDDAPKILGLTFENVLKHFPIGAIKEDKALDWHAITTALLAEVQQLRIEVDELRRAA